MKTIRSSVRAVVALQLLGALMLSAGCLPERGVGVGTVLGYEGLPRDIRWFYEARAWERNATCTMPEISAIMSAVIVEENDEQIIADIRYSWLDDTKLDDGAALVTTGVGSGTCRGIDTRTFTLAKQSDGSVRVVAMTGPQHEP